MRLTQREVDGDPGREHALLACSECGFATPRDHKFQDLTNVTALARQSRDAPTEQHSLTTLRPTGKHGVDQGIDVVSLHDNTPDLPAMAAVFANHYQVLDLPVFASRHQVRRAYQQGLRDLDNIWPNAARSQAALTERVPVISASDSLRVFFPPEVIKAWHSNEIMITRPKTTLRASPEAPSDRLITSRAIAHRNRLDDAYNILSHPVKRKAYDIQYWRKLQTYERERIKARVVGRASQEAAVYQAKMWRASLDQGHEVGTEFCEERYNRVRDMGEHSKCHKCTIASSMVSGEVVAGFADTMDL